MTKTAYTPMTKRNEKVIVKNGFEKDADAVVALVSPAAGAAAVDPILYWNEVALEANKISHTNGAKEQTGPTLSSRALAIVHLAMYDAYAGIIADTTNLPPYLPGLPMPAAGAAAEVAVAAAAHTTLLALFPTQKAFFDLEWARADLNFAGYNEGRMFGAEVARRMLDDRKTDPGAGDAGYVPSLARGAHRPDPGDPGQGFHAPFYGAQAKLFAATSRFGLDAPPTLNSAEFETALKEVQGKGIAPELMGTLPADIEGRTAEETLIGVYWAYDGASGLGTPPRLYNQIVRAIAIRKGNSVAENARLFALVNVAMSDAGILAWQEKYKYDLWRPVVGIREFDASMGPLGDAGNPISNLDDPNWLPLGAPKSNELLRNFTPSFPAYPSGHATFGAAALHITRLFYGNTGNATDTLLDGIGIVSDELNGVNKDNKGTVRPRHVRKFSGGLWQMIEENGRSRVYLGVHWVFDAFAVDADGNMDLTRNIGGVPLGLKIAEDIFNCGRANGLKKSNA